tara:strand:- start:1026 stop:5063 length:4038 start_codon:yes stop_codon:yes gene_type:complete
VSKATATDSTSLGSNSGQDYTTNLSGSLDEFFINSDTLTSTEISDISDRGETLTAITTTGASTTTYNDNTVTGGNEYYYAVKSQNSIGLSDYTTFVSGLAGSPAQVPTSVATATNSPNSDPLDVTVSWSAPTDVGTGTLTGFEIYRDGTLLTTVGLVSSYTDTVPSVGTYVYSLKSLATHGNSGLSATSSIDTPTAPPTPNAPTLAINNPNPSPFDVDVSWTAQSNGGSAITSTEIFRSTTETGTYTSVGTVTDLDFTDTVPSVGTWFYKIASTNLLGSSAQGTSANIATPTVPSSDSSTTLAINNPNPNPLDITVSFTAPTSDGGSAITGYNLFSSDDNVTFNPVASAVSGDQTITVSGPGTWYFKSQSINNVGTAASQGSAVSITTPTVPTASGVTLSIPSPNPSPLDIVASFTAPSSDGGSAVTGYNLLSSPDDSTYNYVAQAVTTDQTITVANTGTWYFKSQAINNIGNGTLSSAVSIATPNAPDAPSLTVAINDVNTSPLTITSTFVAPSSDGGSSLTGYNLFTSPDDSIFTSVASGVNVNFNATVANSGTWYLMAQAVNNAGTSVNSTSVSIATPNAPDAPSLTLTINNPNPNPLDITTAFIAPASDGGSALIGYNLYSSNDNTTYNPIAEEVNGNYTTTVPTPGTWYFKSEAINNVGNGTLSSAFTIATPTVPDAPSLTLAINDPNPSPFGITASFVAPSNDGGSSLINYNLQYSDDDSTYISLINGTLGNYNYTVATPGTHYFKSEVTNNVGTSLLSSAFNIATPTVPIAISDLAGSTVSDTANNLTWTAPNNGGSNIIDYTVFRDGTLVGTVTTPGFSDTGLTQQTSYVYTVFSRNNAGTSLTSNSVTQTTHGVPDQVAVFTATTAAIDQLNLAWTAPNDYNSAITGYIIEREIGVGGGFTPLVTLGVVTSYSDPGLTSVQEYNYRIKAVNFYGNGPTNTASAITLPAPPTNVVVTPSTSTSELAVTWTNPSLTTGITGYQILREDGIGAGFSPINTVSGPTFTDTGLSTNIYYNYKLASVTSQGNSAYSNTYSQTTYHLPNGVESLSATSGDLIDAELSWSSPTIPYGYVTNYQIYQSTTGTPNVIIDSTSATTYTATNLDPTITYHWLVAPVTIHGTNSTGNIANATATSAIVIGSIEVSTDTNPNTIPIFFHEVRNGNSTALTITYGTGDNINCKFDYKFARTNYTHSNLAETYVSNVQSSHTFTFTNSANEIIGVHCYDQDTNPGGNTLTNDQNDGQYQINFATQPIVTQVNDFQKGAFGISGGFGAFDLMTMFVVIISMVGFNRKNPAVGVGIMVAFIGAMGYFGIIEVPTIIMGAVALVVILAIGNVRKK